MDPQWICFFKSYLVYLAIVVAMASIVISILNEGDLKKYQKNITIFIYILFLIAPMYTSIRKRFNNQNICYEFPKYTNTNKWE